jgi:hypothetical protein
MAIAAVPMKLARRSRRVHLTAMRIIQNLLRIGLFGAAGVAMVYAVLAVR